MVQQIVLLHSALGLRPGLVGWATHLRSLGHHVHTPDIYDGEVFASVEDGLRKRDAIGIAEIVRRTWGAMANLPAEVVYMGWSLGAAGAEMLAANRPGAKGVILLHGIVAPATLGISKWPSSAPVQVHHAKDDPWVPNKDLRALDTMAAAAGVSVETHCYIGGFAHMFDDPDLPGHAPEPTALMRQRVVDFLEGLQVASFSTFGLPTTRCKKGPDPS